MEKWWLDQTAQKQRFKATAVEDLEAEFAKIDFLGTGLADSLRRRVDKVVLEGVARAEQKQHAVKMRALEEQQKAERRALELKEQQRRREQEEKAAKEKEAKERELLAQEAKLRAAKEAEKAASDKAVKEAKEKAAKEAKEKEAQKAKEKEAKEKAAKEAKEKEAKEKEAKEKEAQKSAPSAPSSSSPAAECPAHIVAEFAANQERIAFIKTQVRKPIMQSVERRNKLIAAKVEMRAKFSMLTNKKTHLVACRDKFKEFLTASSQSGDTLLHHGILNLYSKLLIEQSESEANLALQKALPLAMVTILLWADIPELGDFVIPRIIKRCPQVIGFYCPITSIEGRKKMGWKIFEGEIDEDEDKYTHRLAGVFAVWACMTQTKLSKQDQRPHPYNLGHSWTFVARMVNKPASLLTTTDFELAAVWWDMSALRLLEAFGKQGHKLLMLLWDDFTRGRDQDMTAMRLRGLGENWQSSGVIKHAWEPLS